MYLKFRYQLGYEGLVAEVNNVSWRLFTCRGLTARRRALHQRVQNPIKSARGVGTLQGRVLSRQMVNRTYEYVRSEHTYAHRVKRQLAAVLG